MHSCWSSIFLLFFISLWTNFNSDGFRVRFRSTVSLHNSFELRNGFYSAVITEGRKWTERHGNMVCFRSDKGKPKAVVHFIGGAFFGSAPHIFYRNLLEGLADEGYIVLASPYQTKTDHIAICDSILARFDALAAELAVEYGPLVVIGIGHSLGAVLQTLITSLFPDTPRAMNILISYCSRGIRESIPLFDDVVLPLSRSLIDNPRLDIGSNCPLVPLTQSINDIVMSSNASLFRPTSNYLSAIKFLEQFPSIIEEIGQGSEDFSPQPNEIKEICRRMYRARRTFVIKFIDDALDDSDEIIQALKEANTIMRMKRPMVEMELHNEKYPGNHLTPLSYDLLDQNLFEGFSYLPSKAMRRSLAANCPLSHLENIESLVSAINNFLETNINRQLK